MTIGDLFMYISMIALLTMPVIQLANIGTQITEAFAGLDRIREIRRMATEDEEDADRAADARHPRRRSRSSTSRSSTTPARRS